MAGGIIMSYAGGRALKVHESCKYIAEIDVLTITFYAVMSPMTYESLSADLRKMIDETTGLKMSRACGLALDTGSQGAAQWLREQGTDIYIVPPEERQRWLIAVKPVYDNHIKKLEDQGQGKARAILEKTKSLIQELSSK